jgi:phage baseplate assembly protein W
VSEHLRLPFGLAADGTFQTVTEDSDAEVVQNVAVILRTREGERMATPEFGTSDPTFVGLDPAALLPVVERYEPRADLLIVQQAITAAGVQTNDISVRRQEG